MNDHPVNAISKLLNNLGSKLIKNKYGLDLTFEVVTIREHPIPYSVLIYINVIGDLPYIFKDLSYDDTMWNKNRYGDHFKIKLILDNVIKYYDNKYKVRLDNVKDPLKEDCVYMIRLESVEADLCSETGVEPNTSLSLPYFDNQEWWDNLSDEDKETLKENFG